MVFVENLFYNFEVTRPFLTVRFYATKNGDVLIKSTQPYHLYFIFIVNTLAIPASSVYN